MTILNEPIGTWISIAAFLISLSTLLLAIRKQRHEERTALASKITEIKVLYGQALRTIDETLEENDYLEGLFRKSFSGRDITPNLEMIAKNRSSLTDLRTKVDRIYSNLGHRDPATTDILVLSAVAVESDGINKDLDKQKKQLEDMAQTLKSVKKGKSRVKRPAKLKAQPQRPPKKQNHLN